MESSYLFDQIDLPAQVGAPARRFDRNVAVLRLGHQSSADRNQIALHRVPGQVYPKQVRHARRSEEDARRVPRPRTEIERRLG